MEMRANWGAESGGNAVFVINVVIALGFMMKTGAAINDKRDAGFSSGLSVRRKSSIQIRIAVSDTNRCDAPKLAHPRREFGDRFRATNFDHERHDPLRGGSANGASSIPTE